MRTNTDFGQEKQTFLKDIIANPEEDAVRLIFADWLEDHGEPERAEFIRIQCKIASIEAFLSEPFLLEQKYCTGESASWCPVCGDCTCRDPDESKSDDDCPLHSPLSRHNSDDSVKEVLWKLQARQRALVAGLVRGPLAGIPFLTDGIAQTVNDDRVQAVYRDGDHDNFVVWRRGFIERSRCTWQWWNAHADELTRLHPIEEVRLLTMPILLEDYAVQGVFPQKYWLKGRSTVDVDTWIFPTRREALIQLLKLNWPGIKFKLPEETPA